MPDDPLQSLRLMVRAGVILASAAGLPALIIFLCVRKETLFPTREPWRVPWNGWGVLVAFMAAFVFPTVVNVVLGQSDFFHRLYGPDFPGKMTPDDARDPVLKQAANLRGLWSQTIAIPCQVILIVIGLKIATGATLPQMGLGRERLGRNYVLGYLGWLLLAPMAFVVFAAANALLIKSPQRHPLMDLGPWAGDLEWDIFAIQAALLAPISEELLFRGLMLPWLLQPAPPGPPDPYNIVPPEQRSHVVYAAAFLISVQSSSTLMEAVQARRWDDILSSLAPFFFVLAFVPIYLLLPLSSRVQRWSGGFSVHALRGWLATSILFAAIHSSVWPSPIPLLVLSLGLGWLAMRTRSIIPSIIAHMLFNGVAVVYLRLGGVA